MEVLAVASFKGSLMPLYGAMAESEMDKAAITAVVRYEGLDQEGGSPRGGVEYKALTIGYQIS